MVVRNSQGEEVRVRQPRSHCTLPLAPIQNPGGLNMTSVRTTDAPFIARAFEILDAPFESLLVREPDPLPQNNTMCRGFIARDLVEIITLTVPREAVPGHVFFSRWFKVSKSDNVSARLVQALGELSDCLAPPKVPFTNLHLLMTKILRARRAAHGDLKNWFYQIPIPPAWRRWFAAKLATARGSFEVRCLFVLSMGLAISVFIAHVFSLAIAARIAGDLLFDAWVDNLLWLQMEDNQFEGFDARVREATAFFNIKWSDPPKLYTVFDFVGLSFDLEAKAARLCDKTKQKLLQTARRLDGNPTLTLRESLAAIGLTIWANYAVGRYPLSFFEQLLRWLSATASTPQQLNESVTLPPAVQTDICRLAELCSVASLDLCDLETPRDPGITAFSDASDTALAAVSFVDGETRTSTAPTDATLPIFAREALAHFLAAISIPRHLSTAGFAIDNTNWLHALWRGHSRNGQMNAVLRHMYTHLAASDTTAFAGYVPSRLQLADFPSRHRQLPSNWQRYFEQPVKLRKIPFFRPPPTRIPPCTPSHTD